MYNFSFIYGDNFIKTSRKYGALAEGFYQLIVKLTLVLALFFVGVFMSIDPLCGSCKLYVFFIFIGR